MPDVNDLRNRFAEFLKKPGCAEFIKNLINGTATATNPAQGTDALQLFNEITSSSQRGVVYGDTIKNTYGYFGATVRGSISTHTAQIELPTPNSIPRGLSRAGLEEYTNDQARIRAQAALHETIHHAGRNRFNDFELAGTVAAMQGLELPGFSDVRDASNFWHRALQSACFPTRTGK